MAVVDLYDLKLALGLDPTVTTDDYELQTKLAGAEAEYAEYVRPLPGTYTRTGLLPMFLPRDVDSASVSATVSGASLPVQFDPQTRIVTGYGPYALAWKVTLTYTVGPIPANHLDAIVADVAEYWERTQRSGGEAGRPGFEDPYGAPGGRAPRPVAMYPRIRGLAGPVVA